MENVRDTEVKTKNLVGIIPVVGHDERDFNQPWPDCLMPIGPDYTLIESAVVECAWAGCRSIWIVVNDDFAPIIKKKLGDFASDPVWAYRAFDPSPTANRKRIPIFYVQIPIKHRGKRDSTSFSVVHGALTAFKLMSQLSNWVIPHKYYVRFPHSFFPAWQIREHRQLISSNENFYITSKGLGVKEGNLCSFTFGKEDWLEFRRVIRSGTGIKNPEYDYRDNVLLPIEQRWSARFFKPEDVFAPLEIKEENKVEMENFFNIRNWEEYTDFIAASRQISFRKPERSVLIRPSYNKVGGDDE